MSEADLEAEVIAEEDATGEGDEPQVLPARREPSVPVVRSEVRTAAIAAAGGALAGVATVAAVRAVSGAGTRRRSRRLTRRERPASVVASRSFLVDVHVLGR